MKLKNLPELKNKLKTFLPEYLKQKGIKIERNKCQCPNHADAHEHGDLQKLSAAFLPQSNNTLVYCFVEDVKFDIFDCYAILENKKITGQGFYDCIKSLCTTFEIPYEEDEEYSMKDIELKKKQRILQQIHAISLKNINNGAEYYKKRGLNKEKIKHWKIGFITPDLIDRELDKAFKVQFPYALKGVFSHPALLIPILNEYRQYVGLIFRQFECEKEDNYLNISLEGKNLFNMQSIKGEEYIYLTEGVFDTISLYPETNVVSILTNSIHDKDLEQLTKHNYKKIYLALDADNLYQGKARDGILKSILKLKNVDTSINIIILPTGSDPDSFVREQGLEAFKNLPKMSAIKYLLTNFQKELIKIERIYEFVSGSPSLIRKEKLISIVSKELDIGKKQITKEISKLETKESNYNIVTYVQEKESLCELLSDFTDMAWNKSFKGIQTGYPLFDKYCGGFEDTIYTLVGFPEQGKCFAKNTPILMADGTVKQVQLVEPNDEVMGDTGLGVKVTSIARGKDKMYEIVPNKGDSFTCNQEHILVLNYNTSKNLTIEMTVKEFLGKSKAFQERCKLIRMGVEYPAKDVPYDPYFIGQWLGDGTRHESIITQNEPELENYYEEFARLNNLNFRKRANKERCPSYIFSSKTDSYNPLRRLLKTMYINSEKRIIKDYLINSTQNRRLLLAGLIDSDGYLSDNCWEITTVYKGLKDDILYLARSLGLCANLVKSKIVEGKEYYRIFISGDLSEIPTKLKRRTGSTRVSRKGHLRTGFKVLDKGTGKYYGFTLDKESNGRFLLGDFTITHNTTSLLNFGWQLMLNPKNYVAFYSLDDGAKRSIVPRFMSMATGMPSKAMKEPHEGIKDAWNGGMKILMDLKDNYTIKDGADIRTVADLDEFIKIHFNIAQENNKKFIIIIDNLHSLTSSERYQSVEDTKRVATYLKRIPQQYNCPIITTAEVPKSADKKPTGKDIKESIDIWYASRFVGGIRSDFHDKADSNLIWRDAETNKMYPIIELYVSKNQTGECWHGSLYYKFNFATNRFIECTEEETAILQKGDYLI